VVCYISAGTYESNRPDSSKFSEDVTTKQMKVCSRYFLAGSCFPLSLHPTQLSRLPSTPYSRTWFYTAESRGTIVCSNLIATHLQGWDEQWLDIVNQRDEVDAIMKDRIDLAAQKVCADARGMSLDDIAAEKFRVFPSPMVFASAALPDAR
jgi:hypothetical protein